MKYLLILQFGLLPLSVNAQELENKMIGRWEMFKVIQKGEDVSTKHNPAGNRWFEFKQGGTFESGGDPYGKNTGKFFVNNLSGECYMDSAIGPNDDSIWSITIKDDEMTWQGVGTEWAEGFRIVHVRSKP